MMGLLEFFGKYPGWHRLSRDSIEYMQALQLQKWGYLLQIGSHFKVFGK